MKKIVLAVVTLFAISFASAQQKVGHLNSAEILSAMPEYKTLQENVAKKKQEYAKVLETLYAEYEKKSAELEKGVKDGTMTPAVQELKYAEIQDLQKRIGDFEQKAQDELEKFGAEAMKPLNDKYVKGVKEVAKEKGFTYVLDIAQGSVIYFPENSELDITNAVKTKIGATLTPTSPSGTVAPK